MEKVKLGVIFGGKSTENEVSVSSAESILNNLDKNKYEIYPIYISKDGTWNKCEMREKVDLKEQIKNNNEIDNIIKYLENIDVVFPVLHGLYGEDGTIQGLFEIINKSYVGCGVLASSVGMDKVYTKIIFDRANINQAKYIYLKKENDKYILVNDDFTEEDVQLNDIGDKIKEKLKFPLFVKPSNSGSSVGVNKVENINELEKYIEYAGKFDKKILIEEGIDGKEVECAVLGNDNVISSCVGEIMSAEEFYSYDSKYNNKDSKTLIPANIDEKIQKEIQKLAIKAFKAIDGKGLSRVDFFVENGTNKIYINEINTLPGFTNISMYPKLFEAVGISYKELLDRLIELAQNR